MSRPTNIVFLSIAALGVLVIIGLFLMLMARVYFGWQASHTVASYATVTATVHQQEQAEFIQVMMDFAKENGLSFDSKKYNVNGREELVVMFDADGQNIYESNRTAPELFEASFFARAKNLEDSSLPDRFAAAINAHFGDRAMRK